MKDSTKTKAQLVEENKELRKRVAELTQLEVERKMEEEALRESEEKYRSLFDLSPIGITILDMKGVITSCNSAVYEVGGYSEDELVGGHFSKIAPIRATDLPKFMKIFGSIIKGKVPESFEMEYQRKDGTMGWTEIHVSLLEVNGRKQGILVLQRDIAERKRLEESLRESEERYRIFFEQAADSIVLVDAGTGELVQFNERAYENLGYVQEEFQELKIPDFEVTESEEEVVKHIERVVREGGHVFETKHMTKGGDIRDIMVNARTISIGGRNFIHSIWRDITDQKRTEQAVRESEERYRQLVSTSTDAIILVDAETMRFIEVNKACEELYGYSQEEFRNLTPRDISAEPEKSEAAMKDIIGGRLKRIPVRYDKKKDGTKFPVEISASRFALGDRTVLCSVIRDISKRLKVKEELEKRRRDLRKLTARLVTAQEEERKQVSMELHDEFGQALTALQINLAAIKTELPSGSPSDLPEKLEETSTLADELLERSRELSLELRPTLLDDLGLAPTIRWYTDRFTKRLNVNVEVNVDGFEERLPGEIETVIYRVMQEAMTNISRHAEAKNVRVDLEREKSSVMMLVEDDGKGFDVEAVADQETPEGKLGLMGMEERVGYLGGSLDIRSTPGKGTTIRVEIPMEEGVWTQLEFC